MSQHFNFIKSGKLITVVEENYEAAEKIANEIADDLEAWRIACEEQS